MKKRKDIEVHIGRTEAKEVFKLQIAHQNVVVTEQCSSWPSFYGGRMDDDKSMEGEDKMMGGGSYQDYSASAFEAAKGKKRIIFNKVCLFLAGAICNEVFIFIILYYFAIH